MSPERQSQAQRRESTRRRLLDAAFSVFARDGSSSSVAEIAAAAGCSTGAIYNHFSGKRELMIAVFDDRFPDWVSGHASEASDGVSMAEMIGAVADHWGTVLNNDPLQARLYVEFWMAAQRDPDLREPFRIRQRRIIESVVALIDQHYNGDRAAVEKLAEIVTAVADGIALQALAGTIDDAGNQFRTALLLLTAALPPPSDPGSGAS